MAAQIRGVVHAIWQPTGENVNDAGTMDASGRTAPGSPTISVAIPVYNGGPHLESAVRSVFAQHALPDELVLVDDQSNDGSFACMTALAREAPPGVVVRVIRNPENLGLVGNWNRALRETQGEYVLLFHQDDEMRPTMLQRVRDVLRAHPDVALVHTGFECFEDGEHRQPRAALAASGRSAGAVFVEALARGNFVCCPSVVMARRIYDHAGVFDPRFKFAADQEMWLRAGLHGDVFYLAEPLISYRIHDAMTTTEFMTRSAVRGKLEMAVAPVAALTRNPATADWSLRRQAVGGAVWETRRLFFGAPMDGVWALRIVFSRPLQSSLLLLSHIGVRLVHHVRRALAGRFQC
jgi:glycosyltransferase involved in cell wall biosynthesis